jgi:hypothetical protein
MLMSPHTQTFLAEAACAVPSSNGFKPVAEWRTGDAPALVRRFAS